ncbi:MAG: ATP-dependent RNA helicase [Legionellales bacterium]|nr:ATP-dependent RNA helicase [Legionellales bacterium]HAV93915.1 ATP-dependent RNA helicase [Pseudomonadota bacterium]|tara:strand:- start:1088 stop:2857 length:1770 start_codon:yes stop_codon:yes gene_type:complete
MTGFDNMNLPGSLLENLQKMQFTEPTPIQQSAIPLAIAGRDIIGSAQTGTGKTGAFLIPLLSQLLAKDSDDTALVIAPTRELAQQVHQQALAMMGRSIYLPAALLIGGDSYVKQNRQLDKNPRVVVGTPGRINDHLEQGRLQLSKCCYLVLDETDRMLDMGFSVQIDRIVRTLPEQRQTLLFSATFPDKIHQVAKKYLNNPEKVLIGRDSSPAEHIQQENVKLDESAKHDHMIAELEKRTGSVIVFVKSKFQTERMAQRLTRSGISSDAIHGDLRQGRRNRVIQNFRRGQYRVLVATDVAARGLDIPHIEHVINYDLPQSPEDYIHRIGRTARAGATGNALNFIAPADRRKWAAISELLNPGSGKSASAGRRHSDRSSSHARPSRSRSDQFQLKHRRYGSDDGPQRQRSFSGNGYASNAGMGSGRGERDFSRASAPRSSSDQRRRSGEGHAANSAPSKRWSRPNESGYSDRPHWKRSNSDYASGNRDERRGGRSAYATNDGQSYQRDSRSEGARDGGRPLRDGQYGNSVHGHAGKSFSKSSAHRGKSSYGHSSSKSNNPRSPRREESIKAPKRQRVTHKIPAKKPTFIA